MGVHDKEHYDLMTSFEKVYGLVQPAREPRDDWKHKIIYCNGEINALFLAFRSGYALGKTNAQE